MTNIDIQDIWKKDPFSYPVIVWTEIEHTWLIL